MFCWLRNIVISSLILSTEKYIVVSKNHSGDSNSSSPLLSRYYKAEGGDD